MIIQEPVQAAIWHCLNNYAFQDATFLAERLCTEVETDETIFLLATCYYRSGQVHQAHWLLSTKNIHSPQCRLLLAKCAFELKEDYDAEKALTLDNPLMYKSIDDIVREFGDIACFALQLLARICIKSDRTEFAARAHKRALKLNPFLWQSYADLCDEGENVDPEQVFQFSNDIFQTCQSQNQFGMREATASSFSIDQLVHLVQQNNTQNLNSTAMYSPSILTTPVDQMISTNNTNNLRAIPFDATPPNQMIDVNCKSLREQVMMAPTAKKQFRYISSLCPLTPSFGVMPLTSPLNDSNATILQTPIIDQNEQPVVVTKKIRSHNAGTHIKRKDSPIVGPDSKAFFNHVNNMTNVRRSSRLFSSNNYSVKENTNAAATKTENNKLATTPKSPPRKSKQRIASKLNASLKSNNLNASIVELSEKSANLKVTASEEQRPNSDPAAKAETITSSLHAKESVDPALAQHVLNLKRESVEGLMSLMRDLGYGYKALSKYSCKEALEAFQRVPQQHYESTWVQSMIALAHYEMHEYEAAVRIFKEIHQKEKHRLHLMDVYSTALWHLQKEVELSALAHDLMAQDKTSPVTWCVTGNCFSLHKEHDVAIKFFQRAVQVDPDFVYSYNLLGHELVITEELEKALSCFRTAITKKFRHYTAWFGIGNIYSKQEKFQLAEIHFEKALKINPRNSVILVHIGLVQLLSNQKEKALATLNAAIALDPKNPLSKFHRCRLYYKTERYEEALAELEELKEMVPKEGVVYYAIGKIHKQMGNTDLGLMHFSWASDLDPKGANTQIKESFDNTSVGAAPSSGVGGGSGSAGDHHPSTSSVMAAGGSGTTPTVNQRTSSPNTSNNAINNNNSSNLNADDNRSDSPSLDEDELRANFNYMGRTSGDSDELLASLADASMNAADAMNGAPSSAGSLSVTPTTTTTTAAAVSTTAGAAAAAAANQGISDAMDTPRTWNMLTYDSDSF